MKRGERNVNSQDSLEKIGFLLQKIIKTLHIQGKRALAKKSLAFPQYYALTLLNKGDRYTMSELKKELAITGAGATVVANQLIEKGLIKRRHSYKDRRIVYIIITEKGKNLIKSIHEMRKKFLSSLFNTMNKTDKKTVIMALEILYSTLRDLNGAE